MSLYDHIVPRTSAERIIYIVLDVVLLSLAVYLNVFKIVITVVPRYSIYTRRYDRYLRAAGMGSTSTTEGRPQLTIDT